MIHPRRHVPVNRADFVARLVFAHLLEIHPLPLEHAMVLAAHCFGNRARGAQLDLPDFLEDFAGDHGYAYKVNCGRQRSKARNGAKKSSKSSINLSSVHHPDLTPSKRSSSL